MLNNRAFLNSLNHQIYMAEERGDPVRKASLGTTIDRPAPDFAKLAQSFGWYAEGPIEDRNKVQDAIKRAIMKVVPLWRP